MQQHFNVTSREQIIRNLFDNMSAIKRGMAGHMQAINRDCPVSRAQLELLFTIRHYQPVSFKDLAQQLYLTPGAVSQLAESLEEQKLIVRKTDDHDRRIQSLSVSNEGNKLLRTIEKRRESVMSAIIDGLTDQELAVWLRVQEKMLQHFQSDPNEQPKAGDK